MNPPLSSGSLAGPRSISHPPVVRWYESAAPEQWLWRFSATSFPHRIRKSHRQAHARRSDLPLVRRSAPIAYSSAYQGPFRLKTESSRCVLQLHGTDAQVGKQSVGGCRRHVLGHLGERSVHQLDLRPVTRQFRRRLRQPLARPFQRCRVFIEANQMPLCAEAAWQFPKSAHAKPRVKSMKSRRAERPGIRSLVLKELNMAKFRCAMPAPGGATSRL